MTGEPIGWIAAALTLLTFAQRTMLRLRLAAIGSNVCFIAYGVVGHLYPVLVLHLLLLPCNGWRLWQAVHLPVARPAPRPEPVGVVQTVIDALEVPAAAVDSDMTLVSCNLGFRRLFGLAQTTVARGISLAAPDFGLLRQVPDLRLLVVSGRRWQREIVLGDRVFALHGAACATGLMVLSLNEPAIQLPAPGESGGATDDGCGRKGVDQHSPLISEQC